MTTERSFRGLFWALALTGLLLDQASKYAVFHLLYNGSRAGELEVLPGAFQLVAHYTDTGTPQVNKGALFGLRFSQLLARLGVIEDAEGDQRKRWDNAGFAVISLVAAGAIIWWSTRPATARDPSLSAALGLILAGTVGNFYDRVVFDGVRDFLYFYLINWPVFNIADCCLVCGAFLLLAQAFWTQSAPVSEPRAEVGVPSK